HARNAPLIAAPPKSPSSIIDQAVRHTVSSIAGWPPDAKELPAVLVERTQNPTHGDYSVTLPLKLARTLRRPPITIANELAAAMALAPSFGRTTVAAPGTINGTLEPAWLQPQLAEIATEDIDRAISPEPVALSEFGVEWVQRRIQEDLARLDVRHDQLFLESSLYAGWDEETMAKLASLGRVAQHEGATWFKSDSGKDEVLIKRDGYPTYFWSDILYHRDQFETRGFDLV